jgi:hypothetical protein
MGELEWLICNPLLQRRLELEAIARSVPRPPGAAPVPQAGGRAGTDRADDRPPADGAARRRRGIRVAPRPQR